MKKSIYYAIPELVHDFVLYNILRQPDSVIERTGICVDYYNEWLSYRAILMKHKNNPEKAYQRIKKSHYPLKKYKQREITKHHWVTEKNKKSIKLLDKIVDEMNCMLETPSKFDIKRASTLTQRAMILTRGTDDSKYQKTHSECYRDYLCFTTV